MKAETVFGSLNITWPKLIVFAVAAGIYTGVMAMLPIARETSFADISITFEWWVLFGILIIVNSKTPKESALKCFVFFLISQPLVYLVQVPFSWRGWGLFAYYPPWFIWTLLTIPMGFAGYYKGLRVFAVVVCCSLFSAGVWFFSLPVWVLYGFLYNVKKKKKPTRRHISKENTSRQRPAFFKGKRPDSDREFG